VKRLLALLIGALGVGALLRRRRSTETVAPSPADDLRAKLAETRTVEPGPEPEVEPVRPDPAARRADVHERARRTIDELRD
jgi:hypothetical protein